MEAKYYNYSEVEINGKVYAMPADCEPYSRRWRFWILWQDRNLPIPDVKPGGVLIAPGDAYPTRPLRGDVTRRLTRIAL